jgi:DNA-directed RNA polymerase subunit RPC12/RpoP
MCVDFWHRGFYCVACGKAVLSFSYACESVPAAYRVSCPSCSHTAIYQKTDIRRIDGSKPVLNKLGLLIVLLGMSGVLVVVYSFVR